MKQIMKKFERAMMAAAFAEAGEFDIARELLHEEKPRKTDRPTARKKADKRKELRAD